MPAFEDSTVAATAHCPNGHPVKLTVGQIKQSARVRCTVAGCGGTVKIDGAQARREFEKIDKSFDDLEKTIKNLGR